MPMKPSTGQSRLIVILTITILMMAMIISAYAQQTAGNIRGVVRDQAGALVPGAKVTLADKKTNNTQTTITTSDGEFRFSNVLVGDYDITIQPQGFKTLTLSAVRVLLNQTTDLNATVEAGIQGETIEISAAGQELVQTTTVNLGTNFNSEQNVKMPQATITTNDTGVYNLALLSANVSSSGGMGVGTGGSVGGQRPRQNNFMIDGVDNNDKSVSGPAVYITPEAVSEFSLLTNQYSAEFARSTGGQFITAMKTGGNNYHGAIYGFLQNKYLNSLTTKEKNAGVTRDTMPRYDFGRYGGNVSGPFPIPSFGGSDKAFIIPKDKLFFFTNFERQTIGQSGSPILRIPTTAGFTKLDSLSSVFSAANYSLFKQFLQPYASLAVPDGLTYCAGDPFSIGGRGCDDPLKPELRQYKIEVGQVNIPSPAWSNRNNFIFSMDYNMSEKMQHRGRLIYNREAFINTGASLPIFFIESPARGWLFSYTNLYNITPEINNEFRLAYRRNHFEFPVSSVPFPITTYDTFPNIGLRDIAMNIGPSSTTPQYRFVNNYQFVDNVSWLRGDHSFKFGADFRFLIAPSEFIQRKRGDYQYSSFDRFLRDISPDQTSGRNVGQGKYYGNQKILYLYAQDEWHLRQNLTVNLGLNYVWQQVPLTARNQTINSLSSVPGLLEFKEPSSQKTNFGPRIGLIFSPQTTEGVIGKIFGGPGQSSIRAGFSMAYDVIVDNLYTLSPMPQQQFTKVVSTVNSTSNFFATGALDTSAPSNLSTDATVARRVTSSWIPDQEVPYAIVWNLSIQRQLHRDWGIELRYLGTRGVHLPAQNQINVQPRITDTQFIPTYTVKPSAAELAALTTTIGKLRTNPGIVPAYSQAGFINMVTAFNPTGNSTYNAFSAQVNRRMTRGWLATLAYTWSHLIDDSTSEVFSTSLTPRRAQDSQNLRAERATSGLDRRHRIVISSIYDLPFLKNSSGWKRSLLAGFSVAGTYTYETGEPTTVLSTADSNLNDDTAGDRTIVNLGGNKNIASGVIPYLANGSVDTSTNLANTVAYVAVNPSAYYIQAGLGAKATGGRATLLVPAINNFDFSVSKDFGITEATAFQIRADFLNAFNHPQYTAGSVNSVGLTNSTTFAAFNSVINTVFNKPDQVFTSHARVIQVSARLIF